MQKTLKYSVSRRFSLAMIGVVIVFTLCVIGILLGYTSHSLDTELHRRLSVASHLAEISLPIPLWDFIHEYLDGFVEILFLDDAIAYVDISVQEKSLRTKAHPDWEQYDWSFFEQSPQFLTKSSSSAAIQEISKHTLEVVDEATTARQIADSTTDAMMLLARRSEEIGAFINVIRDITQQTNLLALNASIEAARSGETGKGFAVVAGEVKELARQTAASAEDITHRVEDIQVSSQETLEATRQLSEIIQHIEQFSTTFATAVEQQNASTHHISENMMTIAESSQENTRTITEVASISKQLSEKAVVVQDAASALAALAEHLRQLVDQFTI